MRPSSAKSKGRELQKYVAATLIKLAGFLTKDDVVSRPMGSGGVDIMMSPAAQETFPISIECKNTKSFPGIKALEQAQYNKYPNTLAGVVWKPFGKGYESSIIYFNYEEFVAWTLDKERPYDKT